MSLASACASLPSRLRYRVYQWMVAFRLSSGGSLRRWTVLAVFVLRLSFFLPLGA
jgi:hypothetical protein